MRASLPIRLAALLAVCAVVAPSAADGWGCDGHYTVALIAQRQLGTAAAAQVDKLLDKHPIDPRLSRFCRTRGLTRFVDASTWADDVRDTPRFAHTGPWHYINIQRGAARDQLGAACSANGCVSAAVRAQVGILKGDANGREKADALRFLIHFVGDLHQPMHCTTNSDRGGNCLPVAFFGENPSMSSDGKARPNLHGVWDFSIIDRDPANTSTAAYADRIQQLFQSHMRAWRAAGIHVDDWAWESHELGDSVAYGKLPNPIPVEPDRGDLKSCIVDGDNISRRMLAFDEKLAQPYQDAAQAVIEQQLAKAGTRLAMILNDIWP